METTWEHPYSRSIIARVTLPHSVGRVEGEHRTMVVHMHCQLANGVFGKKKREDFWNWRRGRIVWSNVQVLMGDINMAFQRHTRTPPSRSND